MIDRRHMLLGGLAAATSAQARDAALLHPDLILRNGAIWTGHPDRPSASALSIRSGMIVAIGSDADVLSSAGRSTQVIDLGGRFAMPGINDAHDHAGAAPIGITAWTRTPPTADPPLAELIAALRDAALKAPAGGWIYASGSAPVLRNAAETRAAIDVAVPDHPVLVAAWWGHGMLFNSRGLALIGVDDRTIDPPGGHIDRDKAGHTTGRLDEYAGIAAARSLVPTVPLAVRVAALKDYAQRRLRQGVTTVQVMATAQPIDGMRDTVVAAAIPIRLRVFRFPIPGQEDLHAVPDRQWTPLARQAGVKYLLDGTPIEGLAYQTRDYPGRPGWRGRLDFDERFIEARLATALSSNEQLAFHAVGDATADVVLGAMERLASPERWRTARVRLEHANGIIGANIERARRLGIIIAQPRPTAPVRSWGDAGIPVAYGSDGGFPPWSMFQAMTASDSPRGIALDRGLAMLTAGPAFAEFEEGRKGRLMPGMVADITVLSRDVTKISNTEVGQTESLITIVAGRIAFAQNPFAQLPHQQQAAWT